MLVVLKRYKIYGKICINIVSVLNKDFRDGLIYDNLVPRIFMQLILQFQKDKQVVKTGRKDNINKLNSHLRNKSMFHRQLY